MSEESIQQMKYGMMRHKIVSYHWIFLPFIFDTCKFLLSDVSSVFYMAVAHLYTGSRHIYSNTFSVCTSLRCILCSKR